MKSMTKLKVSKEKDKCINLSITLNPVFGLT